MTGEMNRRAFLVAGGLTTAATVIGLRAGDGAATVPASAGFVPGLDYRFRNDALEAGARLDDLLSRLTLEEKVTIATGGTSAAVPRLGLNAGRGGGGEALHGVQGGGKATVFPSPSGMAQSWDEDLLYEAGDVIAKESIADNGALSRLAPVMDLLHDPRAGRNYETMGEDAYLTGALGTAMTRGMNQRTADGYQQYLPTLKHFMAYNNEINRLWTNSVIPPRVANEYYTRVFRYPVAAGTAKSLMTSYPLINGKPMSVNPFLTDLLTKWTPDYDGTGHSEFRTVNDFGSGSSMWVHSQRYFVDDPDGRALGSAQGLKTGQMSWSFRNYGDAVSQIFDALARGLLTEHDIEVNARRNLALSLRLGDFDHLRIRNPYTASTAVARGSLLAGNRAAALRAGQEQIVLLKNEGILPLRGLATPAAVLVGALGEEVLKDHYTGNWVYDITIKDALENKLGSGNVHFTRAVDTVAIKAANGRYLTSADNATFREPGDAAAADTPILAAGVATREDHVQRSEVGLLFEMYDYGGPDQLLRTPINDRYAQIPHVLNATAFRGTLINNTSAPGEASLASGATQYVVYQKLRIVPTDNGKYGIFSPVAGDGGNNSYGESAMAYDQDDEDVNNGSYLRMVDSGQIVADTSAGHVGAYRNENHAGGPDITQSHFDMNGNDKVVDSLPDEYRFDIQHVQSSEEAIAAALAAAPAQAPVIVVVGYEPHLNAREAVDLHQTGLGDQQKRNFDYLTKAQGRDVVLIVKTGSPMTIDESVTSNPKVKAIIQIAHSGQEEGSALVSALFDDGYSVPASGWAPTADRYSPYNSYSSYPGYLPDHDSIPAYAPAGRLTATWYQKISDMIGASDDEPPASYRWPAYDEHANDNLSNLNGTIPGGLLTYDIIKGQRTYQYFSGRALYPFGYGLTYTTFAYSNLTVSRTGNGRFAVSGRITNTGRILSDEVVQIYSQFAGPPSRIVQPNMRLIAFSRLKRIAPNETRTFRFEIELRDKLAVWDVETSRPIVEPGDYRIRAARSSADTGSTAVLRVTSSNGGTAAARRSLDRQALAENFDDYSNIGGRVADIELVSASTDFHANTAVEFRQNGAWINFKNVSVPTRASWLTVQAGADRPGRLDVYAFPVGASAATLRSAAPIASVELEDTRPVEGLPTGLGIGPFAVTGQPNSNRPYPGSPAGQNGLDSKEQPYKNAYVRPDWRTASTRVSVRPGSYDVYVVTRSRGARIEWLKLAPSLDTTRRVEITAAEGLDSIREARGQLALQANLTPATSVSPVTWTVLTPHGLPTGIATIDRDTGVLRATGTGNGAVLVRANSGGRIGTMTVLITNQLDSNRVVIGGAAKTVDYIILRTGDRFGVNDNIQRFQGTNQQTAIFSGLFSENADGYYLSGTYMTIPPSELDWAITGRDGRSTRLARINDTGLVTATGAGDGQVVVTATLKNNPDISGTRVITVTNQAVKNAFRMIQAENYDVTSDNASIAATWGLGGNEFGLQVPMSAGSTWTFQNVDFGRSRPRQVAVRLAPGSTTAKVAIEIWADAGTVSAGGRLLATVTASTPGSNVNYGTYVAAISAPLDGVHDIVLKPSQPVRVNWFAFSERP
jgi:beta-glucosidase